MWGSVGRREEPLVLVSSNLADVCLEVLVKDDLKLPEQLSDEVKSEGSKVLTCPSL